MDNVTVWPIGLIALLALLEIYRIHSRLDRMEALLDRLSHHLGVETAVLLEPSETVKRLARDKKSYVAAIRAYRQQTGLGLKPAKEVVDRIVAEHRATA